MMNSFASLLPWFLHYGYLALFLLMFTGSLYLPVPSNIALIGAGALSHFSQNGLHFNIFIAALIGLAGSTLGDVISYYIARKFSSKKRREKFEKKHKSLHKIEKYLKKHPLMTISVTRLIGFLSPITNSLAGFSKLKAHTFILGDIIGNIIYVIIFMGAGYVVGSASGHLVDLLGFATGTLVILALIYIGGIVFMREK
jgi:membrane-associated protein